MKKAMQSRVCRILFLNLSGHLSELPKASTSENSSTAIFHLHPFLPSVILTHFSSIPNRPMRGDRRGDDQSEEHFLRNLNFGDDSQSENTERTHQNPQPRMVSRPLRGEQRPDTFRGDKKPTRGEGREDFDVLRQKEPPLFGNGPRDEVGRDGSFKIGSQSDDPTGIEKGGDRFSDTLFKKLNLGDIGSGKKVDENRHSPPTQVPTTDSSVPEPPPQDADEIFKKMKETGLIPNAVAMLDGLCKDGLIQEAMKLFGLMREKGTIPEVVIYTAVVEGFCKAAKFDDGKRIFRKMQKNGIVPNAFSYAVLIQGLCKGGRLEDCVEFCIEMLDAGHSPNAATFTGLVDGFCKEKGVEEAESVVRSLRDRGFAVDDKAVREHLDKKGPYSPMVWEAIFGKKNSQRVF